MKPRLKRSRAQQPLSSKVFALETVAPYRRSHNFNRSTAPLRPLPVSSLSAPLHPKSKISELEQVDITSNRHSQAFLSTPLRCHHTTPIITMETSSIFPDADTVIKLPEDEVQSPLACENGRRLPLPLDEELHDELKVGNSETTTTVTLTSRMFVDVMPGSEEEKKNESDEDEHKKMADTFGETIVTTLNNENDQEKSDQVNGFDNETRDDHDKPTHPQNKDILATNITAIHPKAATRTKNDHALAFMSRSCKSNSTSILEPTTAILEANEPVPSRLEAVSVSPIDHEDDDDEGPLKLVPSWKQMSTKLTTTQDFDDKEPESGDLSVYLDGTDVAEIEARTSDGLTMKSRSRHGSQGWGRASSTAVLSPLVSTVDASSLTDTDALDRKGTELSNDRLSAPKSPIITEKLEFAVHKSLARANAKISEANAPKRANRMPVPQSPIDTDGEQAEANSPKQVSNSSTSATSPDRPLSQAEKRILEMAFLESSGCELVSTVKPKRPRRSTTSRTLTETLPGGAPNQSSSTGDGSISGGGKGRAASQRASQAIKDQARDEYKRYDEEEANVTKIRHPRRKTAAAKQPNQPKKRDSRESGQQELSESSQLALESTTVDGLAGLSGNTQRSRSMRSLQATSAPLKLMPIPLQDHVSTETAPPEETASPREFTIDPGLATDSALVEAYKAPCKPLEDLNPYYVEETAWIYHNPTEDDVPSDQLPRLPLPPPLPEFPKTGFCQWSFDEESRVLYANFRQESGKKVVLNYRDEKFLLTMMERDDISVITEGLVSNLDPKMWSLRYLSKAAGGDVYHGFRRFQRNKMTNSQRSGKRKSADTSEQQQIRFREVDKCLAMKVSDYVRYLEARQNAILSGALDGTEFCFNGSDGAQNSIDVFEDILYMIDFDMVKLLPKVYEDFVDSFAIPEILPGGKHCLLNAVNINGRPFMGPNMYVTPPGAFTHLHQDGHGTVDSGHFCVSGNNEVVMLRRLTERHKNNALSLLNAKCNILYELPHGDGLGEKPSWPSNQSIQKCKEMGYCPSVFVLRPGQLLHINKGRIHAFRKQTSENLPLSDCHAELRAKNPPSKEEICVSVAWDWQYRGVTCEGINREIAASLECAAYNRAHRKRSLAIPETALLQIVRTLPASDDSLPAPSESSFLGRLPGNVKPQDRFAPSRQDILKGILPSLQFVVEQHERLEQQAKTFNSKNSQQYGPRILWNKTSKPNSCQNPELVTVEPFGNDFFCRLCHCELSNLYLHCEGCEKILHKDFNICGTCFENRLFATRIAMHPLISGKNALNHCGKPHHPPRNCKGCPCKQGPACGNCHWCPCSCQCHQWFAVNYRFFKMEDEYMLLQQVEDEVGNVTCQYGKETKQRLELLSQYRVPAFGFTAVPCKSKVSPNVKVAPGATSVSKEIQPHSNTRAKDDSTSHGEEDSNLVEITALVMGALQPENTVHHQGSAETDSNDVDLSRSITDSFSLQPLDDGHQKLSHVTPSNVNDIAVDENTTSLSEDAVLPKTCENAPVQASTSQSIPCDGAVASDLYVKNVHTRNRGRRPRDANSCQQPKDANIGHLPVGVDTYNVRRTRKTVTSSLLLTVKVDGTTFRKPKIEAVIELQEFHKQSQLKILFGGSKIGSTQRKKGRVKKNEMVVEHVNDTAREVMASGPTRKRKRSPKQSSHTKLTREDASAYFPSNDAAIRANSQAQGVVAIDDSVEAQYQTSDTRNTIETPDPHYDGANGLVTSEALVENLNDTPRKIMASTVSKPSRTRKKSQKQFKHPQEDAIGYYPPKHVAIRATSPAQGLITIYERAQHQTSQTHIAECSELDTIIEMSDQHNGATNLLVTLEGLDSDSAADDLAANDFRGSEHGTNDYIGTQHERDAGDIACDVEESGLHDQVAQYDEDIPEYNDSDDAESLYAEDDGTEIYDHQANNFH